MTSPSTVTTPAAREVTLSAASTIKSPAVTASFNSTSFAVDVRLTTPVAVSAAPTVTVSEETSVALVSASSDPIAAATLIVEPASAVKPN